MLTCGMYDYSGNWAYDIGVPAKSGVGGGIVGVANRQLGIGTLAGGHLNYFCRCELDHTRILQTGKYSSRSSRVASIGAGQIIAGHGRVAAAKLLGIEHVPTVKLAHLNEVEKRAYIVLGEAHLRQVLIKFATYYNECRIHRSLNKDAPFHRAIERLGAITSQPVLGGLHHQYCRA
jgi:Glutaminase